MIEFVLGTQILDEKYPRFIMRKELHFEEFWT